MGEHDAAGLAVCRGISTPCAKLLAAGFSFSCVDDAVDPQPQMTRQQRRHAAQRHVIAFHTPRSARVFTEVAQAAQRLVYAAQRRVFRSHTITIWDFTGRKDSSGNQRESATLFPQDLSLYSRRAVPLFPQGCPFIPAGLSFYSRLQGWRSSPGRHLAPARPAPTAMAGIRAARHEGPRR